MAIQVLSGTAGNAAVGAVQRGAPGADRFARHRGSCARGLDGIHALGGPRRRAPCRAACAAAGRGRADRGAARRDRRRYLPHRCDRSPRQYGERDALGWLAAIIAGHSGTRLLHGHARADVLAADGLPNSLAPGKRPRTTLSPSFALREGKPWMAFGTPGGEQQDQWALIFFLRMVHHGMTIQQAIDAPSLPYRALAEQFLAACGTAGEGGAGGPVRRRRCWASWRRAVICGARGTIGRKAGCPGRGLSRCRCLPAPIRAACRATRSVGEVETATLAADRSLTRSRDRAWARRYGPHD